MIFENPILHLEIQKIYIDFPNQLLTNSNILSYSNLNKSLQLVKEGNISNFKIYFHFFPDCINLEELNSELLTNNDTSKRNVIKKYSEEIQTYSYSENDYINRIPDEKMLILNREFHNLTIVNILIPINFFRLNWIQRQLIFQTSTREDHIVNQIIYFNNTRNGSLISSQSNRIYNWEHKNYISNYASNEQNDKYIFRMIHITLEILGNMFSSFFEFAFLSIFLSLIIRMILYGASIFVIWINNITCWRQINQISQDFLFTAIPWIGVYTSYLMRTNRNIFPICIPFTILFVFAEIFAISIQIFTDHIFRANHFITREETSLYFYNILFIELMSFLFLRTRISLKYSPKFLTIVNIIFLYYYFSNSYPLYYGSLFLCISIEAFIFFLFIKYSEMKSTEWNPFNPYTPSLNNPRQCYILAMEKDYMFGFNLWIIFYINSFRSEFLENEQDLRDANNLIYNFDYTSIRNNPN